MTLHDDLLAQSWHLFERDDSQASLRRAVLAAHYALFHLLITESVSALGDSHPPALQARMRRAFAHADMKSVCDSFAKGNLSKATQPLISLPIEADLKAVAKAFVDLQESRLAADYDLGVDLDIIDAIAMHAIATLAFKSWSDVKTSPNASVFLMALLLGKHWNR